VLDSITRMTGIRVLSGSGPNNLYAQTVVPSGGRTEAARDILLRAFEATGRKLSWHLLYSPGQKLFMFNVHIVPDLAAGPVE